MVGGRRRDWEAPRLNKHVGEFTQRLNLTTSFMVFSIKCIIISFTVH